MRLETFFEKFELFADAPNAIAKMRELVVDLAVRGKLVPNNPEERPVRLNMSADSGNSSIPPNWRSGVLGDAITLEYGDNLPAGKRSGSGEYPVYGSNGIVGTHDSFLTKEPAIIVGRKGSAGALNIANGPSWTTDVAYFVRPPADLDLRFTYYLLSSLHLDELGKGIKPGLSRKEAYVLPISLPPLAEQRRIVAKVDELIALCDRLDAQQQERDTRHAALARASLARFAEAPTPANLDFLFHNSYTIAPVDLRKTILTLAVQGKLVPQVSDDEQNALDLTNSGSVTDAPHDIPETWTWVHLGELGQFINGDRSKNYPSKNFRVETGVPFINAGHLANGDVALNDRDYITEEHFGRLGGGKVEQGDVLYCLRGSLGKAAVVTSIERGAIASSLLIVRPSKRILGRFLYAYLTSPLGATMISKYDNGSAQPNLSAASVKKYLVPLPPLAEQRRIVAKVDQLMALVDQLETQLTTSRATAAKLMEAVVAELTAANQGAYRDCNPSSKREPSETNASQAETGLSLQILQPLLD